METKTTKENQTKTERYMIFRPIEQSDGEKKLWPRVGVAFRNRDGSMNLIIHEAIEPNTRLQLRSFQPRKRA